MPQMGVVRAEGTATAAVQAGDKFVVQRFGGAPNNYYQPFEATIAEVNTYVKTNSLAGSSVLAVGTATLVAGTVNVPLASITAGSKVLLTPADSTPNALGYTIHAGASFDITSASGADTSVVSYVVFA